jgi:cardiolipin synthase
MITLFFGSAIVLSCAAAGHALLNKRDSRSALVWVSINLTLPLVGPFFYWCLGINRISRRAKYWHDSGRWLSKTEIFPMEVKTAQSKILPASAEHLTGLQLLTDRIVTTHQRSGNHLSPLIGGEEAYSAMLASIRDANETINLSSYIFDVDGIGAEFVKELSAAALRGVAVRIIIDALGEKYSRCSLRLVFRGTPVKVVRYLPLSNGAYINLRNHRKLMIVDGRNAFTGGMNIRNNHLMKATTTSDDSVHDVHFCVNGPIVSDLQRIFLGDWYFVTGEKLQDHRFFPVIEPCGSAMVRCISDGPNREFRKIEQIIIGALSCAKQHVYIMTPYFIPNREMMSALITAVLRGVDVHIALPGENNLPFVHWAGRAFLWELLMNGVRVFYQPPPFVHTKLLLVDSIWSLIGSANLDTRSLRLNFELDLSIFDECLAIKLQRHFEQAIAASHELSLAEVNRFTLPVRLRDNFARLFSPYL